jgi:hypothetical protein
VQNTVAEGNTRQWLLLRVVKGRVVAVRADVDKLQSSIVKKTNHRGHEIPAVAARELP